MLLTWIVWRKTEEGGDGYPATCCRHCSSSAEEKLRPDWHFSPEGRETQCWPWWADPENILDFMKWSWKCFPERNGMERMCRYHFVDNLTRDIFNQGNLISLQRPQFFPLVFCWESRKNKEDQPINKNLAETLDLLTRPLMVSLVESIDNDWEYKINHLENNNV